LQIYRGLSVNIIFLNNVPAKKAFLLKEETGIKESFRWLLSRSW